MGFQPPISSHPELYPTRSDLGKHLPQHNDRSLTPLPVFARTPISPPSLARGAPRTPTSRAALLHLPLGTASSPYDVFGVAGTAPPFGTVIVTSRRLPHFGQQRTRTGSIASVDGARRTGQDCRDRHHEQQLPTRAGVPRGSGSPADRSDGPSRSPGAARAARTSVKTPRPAGSSSSAADRPRSPCNGR